MGFPSQFRGDSASSTGFLFIQAYNRWHTEIKKRLKVVGITHPQFVVLTSLGYLQQSEDFVTQVRIASLADMDVMTVSQIVKLLEKNGYLVRSEHPVDTRAKVLQLNKKGQETIEVAVPLVEALDQEYFGSLGEEEAIFRQALLKINKVVFDR